MQKKISEEVGGTSKYFLYLTISEKCSMIVFMKRIDPLTLVKMMSSLLNAICCAEDENAIPLLQELVDQMR